VTENVSSEWKGGEHLFVRYCGLDHCRTK